MGLPADFPVSELGDRPPGKNSWTVTGPRVGKVRGVHEKGRRVFWVVAARKGEQSMAWQKNGGVGADLNPT